MSLSTWTKAPTSPSQILTPQYNTSTARASTHQSPQRTYPPASTNDCHPFNPTKRSSIKPPPHIKKHATNADISTLFITNYLQLPNEKNGPTLVQPPFSKNVSTIVGRRFLALVDKHFPKDHKLNKRNNWTRHLNLPPRLLCTFVKYVNDGYEHSWQ